MSLFSRLLLIFSLASSPLITHAQPLTPTVITEATRYDTDDPAIWLHPGDPTQSLILGTDKDMDGALYVYDLQGRIQSDKVVRGLVRPNNVDVAYNIMVGGRATDIAVVSERYANRLRVYRLPDMAPIDGGGIPVFQSDAGREVMGIALYTRPTDNAVFAFVSRSEAGAPKEGYLHQYRLIDDGTGTIRGIFTRAVGSWSGAKEIEALAIDNELGYLYYSDETYGIRKYMADPMQEDAEDMLAEFGLKDFARDHEGISIYKRENGTGYILISDQQRNAFNIYAREGHASDPHRHELLARVEVQAIESDGSDITHISLPGFPGGLFVTMSTDKTFHFYSVSALLQKAGLGL